MEIVCFALALHLEVDPRRSGRPSTSRTIWAWIRWTWCSSSCGWKRSAKRIPRRRSENVFTVNDLARVVRRWNDGPPTVRVPDRRAVSAASGLRCAGVRTVGPRAQKNGSRAFLFSEAALSACRLLRASCRCLCCTFIAAELVRFTNSLKRVTSLPCLLRKMTVGRPFTSI